MKITLTKEQYLDLIKIVYLGDWLVNSYRVRESDMELEDIEQHIYSYGKEFGFENLLKENEGSGKIYPTGKFDDMLSQYFEEYDNEVFWETLIEQMAIKELLSTLDKKEISRMSTIDRVMKLEKFRGKYETEFEKNGLKNVEFKRGK